MKLLVNKNCSGYHWFDCELSGDEQYIKMYEAQSVNQDSSFLGSLRIYGQFDYCLLRDNNKYMLAINNLPEEEKDTFGRQISTKMIFIGEKDYAPLLLKVLLTAIEDFDSFSKKMNSSFASSSMSNPIYVRCDWQTLRSFIQEIDAKVLTPDARKILDESLMRLIIVSDESLAMGRNGIGFSDKEIHKAKENLKVLNAGIFFQTAPLNVDEKDVTSINESKRNDISDKADKNAKELEELQKKFTLLNNMNSELQNKLDTAKLESQELRTSHTRKLRLYKGVLAISGAAIVTLLILYVSK